MENEKNESFDLLFLLRFGDLDIRGIASNNILVEEYSCLLSEFLNNAPQIADTLARIANLDTDKSVIQRLKETQALLASIGCNKFMRVFNKILSAEEEGDKESAASYVKPILNDFNRFISRVERSKRTGEVIGNTGIPEGDSQNRENLALSYGTLSLKKTLQILDQEEAYRKMRVLAVDDAPVMIKLISSALSIDYKVYGLTDPRMLEPFLQQITPELFILDYRMPDVTGFDLIPVIRGFEEHKTTPIIFLTSMGTSDHISTAVNLGACDYIVKPFQAVTLRQKVAKHIARKTKY